MLETLNCLQVSSPSVMFLKAMAHGAPSTPQSIKVRKRKHMYDNNSYYLHLADGCVISTADERI
jgi:hypothetical protein